MNLGDINSDFEKKKINDKNEEKYNNINDKNITEDNLKSDNETNNNESYDNTKNKDINGNDSSNSNLNNHNGYNKNIGNNEKSENLQHQKEFKDSLSKRNLDNKDSEVKYEQNLDNKISNNQNKSGEQVEKISSEVECSICMKLLIVPVTIPCGHNFCRDCLEKVKEYKNSCPLCRSNMGDKKNINILLGELIKEKYPITYAKRLEEIENLKREKENKIMKQRNDAIKNASIIPIFKIPLIFGPYFPGEVFSLTIYNLKFINFIQFISPEGVFAITSSKKNNDNDKMYGIHVKILEQKNTNQVFYIKCLANFRVVLYNLTHFIEYDNYVANHYPIFDEVMHINLIEYNLWEYNNNKSNMINIGMDIIHNLKRLLIQVENEEDVNLISDYYRHFKNITNNMEISDSTISSVIRYFSCVILSRICLLCIKKQLNRFGKSGIRLFNNKFRNLKLASSEPSTEELEIFSYSLSSAIISKSLLKWKWFKTTDTSERLESITQYFLKKKNKSILALDNSRSPIIHRLFMLDSITSSLSILIFILTIIFVKYFVY
ncbi:RING zinc finger protein, putative [Plasmodium gallinaceum]|uniref:RING zinc finger protein, putative n=1 Tax=Plasmodium gallinaceum TaxID=5849 RepID=A0A1J1GUR1_PLAGA|nr:RING zinc finger protein, putative [Plasmodium gallinaceum]CRG96281.1 RING zinc finger protein, putative [Plasmodium gallinaceum]